MAMRNIKVTESTITSLNFALSRIPNYILTSLDRAMTVFADRAQRYGTDNVAQAGPEGLLARIRDKVARLDTLLDEPEGSAAAIDTAIDLANYALMMASLTEGSWPKAGRKECLVRHAGAENIVGPKIPGDVGYDLRASESVDILPRRMVYVRTGVAIKAPLGTWFTITMRSGHTRHRHAFVPSFPVLDGGFTGELEVPVFNAGVKDLSIRQGERFAQVVFFANRVPALRVVRELPETARGTAGFGSTGR